MRRSYQNVKEKFAYNYNATYTCTLQRYIITFRNRSQFTIHKEECEIIISIYIDIAFFRE